MHSGPDNTAARHTKTNPAVRDSTQRARPSSPLVREDSEHKGSSVVFENIGQTTDGILATHAHTLPYSKGIDRQLESHLKDDNTVQRVLAEGTRIYRPYGHRSIARSALVL